MKKVYLSNHICKWLFLFLAFFPGFSLLAQTSAANSSVQPGKSFLVRPWTVGQTVTLQTKIFNGDALIDTLTRTYSIVGEETVKGKNYLWLEIENKKNDGSFYIHKLQVRKPGPIDFENVAGNNRAVLAARREIRYQVPAPFRKVPVPFEFPMPETVVSQVENGPEPTETKDRSMFFNVSPEETVVVSAGTFKTTKFDYTTKNENAASDRFFTLWGSPEVPIWGIVKKSSHHWDKKLQGVVTEQTELISYSETGAVSKITSEPQLRLPHKPTPTPLAGKTNKHSILKTNTAHE